MMPVALLPPVTSSGAWSPPGMPKRIPLTESQRYARCRAMSRWHRVRSGYQAGDHPTYHLWCGTSVTTSPQAKAGPPLLVDDLPVGDEACAVCVGKALGAGQDETPDGMPPLRYDPRWLTPPSVCPGSGPSGLFVEVPNSRNVVQCLACGLLISGRAMGSPYNPSYGAVKHAPGDGLVNPCPLHAWNQLTLRGDSVGCACGWSDAE